jgi:glycyl-tRNA synthetase beta chain
MGREYALYDGEEPAVAAAIAEHYLPTQAGGDLPASDAGAFVSMADKLDTICGCFGVGLIPTGSADPYALRRSALGIINIIVEREYRLSLAGLIDRALELLAPKLTRPAAEVKGDVLEFFRGRFVNLMADRYPADAVDAAVAAGCDDLLDAASRIGALSAFKDRPDFAELAVTFKRVGNIVMEGVETSVTATLFQENAERALLTALEVVEANVAAAVGAGNYMAALEEIAALRGPVDAFFDKVMVMAEDEQVRENRLALLTRIARLFSGVADFGRIG